MTIWDNIYKNYRKGGQAWATLSEEVDGRFIRYLEKSQFKQKSAFDIGCGTGKYLKFLAAQGFAVSGIDNSKTAIEMTKENLLNAADITIADMYNYQIPRNKYDLIISVSTLHHGTKEQIGHLIEKIYDCLLSDGKIFITLPDIECNKKWNTFKDDKEVAPGTYSPMSGPEKGLPHSFFDKEEIEKFFNKFSNVNLDLDEIGRWFITARKK